MSHIQTLIPPDAPPASPAALPAIALFADDHAAAEGLLLSGATLLRTAGPGVLLLVAEEGLTNRLYEAGALLVFT